MEYLIEYGVFLAKFATILILLLIAAGILIALLSKNKHESEQLEIRHLNDKYADMRQSLNNQLLDKKTLKQLSKEEKKRQKAKEKDTEKTNKLFVLDFKGDIKASHVSSLREAITAILTIATKNDEVLVLIESGGGVVHGYGLGASQLKRIRDKGIRLTVAVDKVAASGGYMMACVADKIIAAPFAIVGSIGVLAQIPNFHRLLKKWISILNK